MYSCAHWASVYPLHTCGVCVCVWCRWVMGVVIINDISWARSNQCSLLLICYIYLSSPSFYHSYYHFISVFIYLLCSLLCPLPSPFYFFHLLPGNIWLAGDNRSTEATDASSHNSSYRNIAFFSFIPRRGGDLWDWWFNQVIESFVNWKIMF